MAEYKSKYSELGFYINGSLRQFRGGKYVTTTKAEIDVLDKLTDVTKIEEKQAPAKKAETKQAEAKPKTQAKPKPNAKSSAKK